MDDRQPVASMPDRLIRWFFGAGPKPWLSSLSIIVTNLFMLVGVLFLHWDVFAIMFIFWAENVIIGVFNVARMAAAGQGGCGKLFLIPFFCVHYGMFCFVHGIFVIALFGGALGGVHTEAIAAILQAFFSLQLRDVLRHLFAYAPWLGWSLLLLFGSHAVSFARDYLLNGAYQRASIDQLMSAPYGRIVLLHLVLGGFLIALARSPLIPLLLLIVLKTAFDLRAFWREQEAVGVNSA